MPDDNNYHERLSADAERLWAEHMAECDDAGIPAEHGFNVLLTAAAVGWAHGIAWGEEGEITRERLREVVDDFELALGKTVIELAPDRLPATVRAQIEALDLRVKRARDLPAEGGTA